DGPLGRLFAVLAVFVIGVRVRHDDPAEDVQAAYRAVAGQADDAWAPAAPAQVDDAAAVDRVLGGADGSGQSHEDHAIGMGWPTAATAAGRGGAWPQTSSRGSARRSTRSVWRVRERCALTISAMIRASTPAPMQM